MIPVSTAAVQYSKGLFYCCHYQLLYYSPHSDMHSTSRNRSAEVSSCQLESVRDYLTITFIRYKCKGNKMQILAFITYFIFSFTFIPLRRNFMKSGIIFFHFKIQIYIIIPKCACVCVCLCKFYLKTVSVNNLILFAT